jgi:hypothetical protein
MHESMMTPLASESLDLDPANPSSLDIITATRAGTATYTDASGNIQTASPNTVRVDHVQGEELTPTKFQHIGYTDFSSGWGSASSQAGDGYLGNASRVVTFNGFGTYIHQVATDNTKTYKASIYLKIKSGDSSLIRLFHQLQSGGGSNSVIAATTDWQRFDVTLSSTGTYVNFGVAIFTSGTVEVEIAMPQVEEGTTASDFVANTTGSPKYFAAATYAPRVPMILVEPAATNLLENTDFVSGWSLINATREVINIPSPLPSQNVIRLTNQNNIFGRVQDIASSSSDTTISVYVKRDGVDTRLRISSQNYGSSNFNVDESGVSIESNGGLGYDIQEHGDGWWRVSASFSGVGYASFSSDNELGTRSVLLAMPQVEEGTVATSFIPTSGSAVTRAADDLVIDGSDFTDFYNATEGTFYFEGVPQNLTDAPIYWMDTSPASQRIAVYDSFNVNAKLFIAGTSSEQSASYYLPNQLARLAISVKSNAQELSVNGGTSVTLTESSLPSPTSLHIGSRFSGSDYFNGHIKRLIYWPYHSDNL